MIIYHGSNITVENPNLDLSRKNLDFGAGFYTTGNKDQAVDFAHKVMIRKGQKNQSVSVYDFDIDAAKSVLGILQFSAPDRLWLDFVHQNRQGTYTGKSYDLIIGPVANDDVFTTLIVYEQGILNIEQTLEALKVKKLYNQIVFKTEKALSLLKYVNSFEPDENSGPMEVAP
ncbi:MAG: DUF3990 domain-containing protein [Treponema sp.]|jgi:hypothetical protein|nr:DUF3990 domain-containing protein [Treponema sp.]